MLAPRDIDEYVLPTERRVIRFRRHWVSIVSEIVQAVVLMGALGVAAYLLPDGPVLDNMLWYAALLVLIAGGTALWWLMHRTNYGRLLHAVGDNPEAARLAGVPVARVRVLAFVVSSLSAVVAGILLGGFSGVSLDVGSGYELQAITAAVLGGTSLFGGMGTVVGTIVGALMIGLINNGLILMGLEFSQQLIARGGIIILAVALSQKRA